MKKGIVTPQIKYFLDIVEGAAREKKDTKQTLFKLETSELTDQMALWYEKVRTAVQYKEEHLLRRTAIYRILKRLILIEQRRKKREITYAFFVELVMAGYIQQNDANDHNFLKTEGVIARYLRALGHLNDISKSPTDSMMNRRWFINLASEEIENLFNPQKEKMALIYAIYETLRPKIKFKLDRIPFPLPGSEVREIQDLAEEYLGAGSLLEPFGKSSSTAKDKKEIEKNSFSEEKLLNLLTYLAVFRNLKRSDRSMLRSLVFNIYFPKWGELDENDEKKIKEITHQFFRKKVEIEIIAEHPLMPRILFPIKKYMLCAAFLYEAIMDSPLEAGAVMSQEYLLHNSIKEKCNLRYAAEKKKLNKRIFRGIIYIFFTKMLVAILLEVPYETVIRLSSIDYHSILINLFFPPILLGAIASSARKPTDENTKEIVKGVDTLVYKTKQGEDLKTITITDRENTLAERLLDTFYIVLLISLLYGLIKLLSFLDFNPVATFIFLIFTGTVSFFGALIRQSIRDLIVTKDREGIVSLIFDTVLLPFVRIGRLLSVKFSRINVFIFILDFLIEAPFKFIIRAFEAWIDFLRRKRDEIERQLD